MTTTQDDIEKITSSREFWKLVYHKLREIRRKQDKYIKENHMNEQGQDMYS